MKHNRAFLMGAALALCLALANFGSYVVYGDELAPCNKDCGVGSRTNGPNSRDSSDCTDCIWICCSDHNPIEACSGVSDNCIDHCHEVQWCIGSGR